jgi:hypothetical protein
VSGLHYLFSIRYTNDTRLSSTAAAKKAMGIRDATIRGSPVLIRVPNKFFRLATLPRDTTEAGPTSYSRYTSHPNNRSRVSSTYDGKEIATPVAATDENTSYSPQDARSDLPKTKKKTKHPQQGTATAGSPEARKVKAKKRLESPKKDNRVASVEETSVKAPQQTTKTDVAEASPELVSDVIVTHEAPKEQSGANEIGPSHVPEEQPETGETVPSDANETVPSIAAQEQNEPSNLVDVPVAAGDAPDLTSDQPQTTVAEEPHSKPPLDLEPQVEGSKKEDPSEKLIEADEGKTQPVPTEVVEGENVASDDEMKNEASFHSAAESPTELVTKGDLMVDSGTEEHGPTSAVPEAANIASVPVAENETVETASSSQDDPPSVLQDKEPLVTAAKAADLPSVDLKAAEVAHTVQENEPPTPVVSIPTEPPRKAGAQKTESLHPFSKAAKAQAKKEKEQKKKAQKKEREQAEKAKSAKAITDKPSAKNAPGQIDESVHTTGSTSRDKSANDAKPKAKDEVIKPSVTSVADEEVLPAGAPAQDISHDSGKPGKRKGKKQSTSIVTTGDSDTNHGKQIGGTVSSPNEPSLVTDKEANIEVPNASQDPDAKFSKQEQSDEATGTPGESIPAVDIAEGPSPSGIKKSKKKKKKAPPAWPNLESRPKSPNLSWMGPIDSATDVQNYDQIMNKACGGEDDSEYSGSDLPKVEDALSPDEGDSGNACAYADGDQDPDKGRQQMASLDKVDAQPLDSTCKPAATCAGDQRLAELEASVRDIDTKIGNLSSAWNSDFILTFAAANKVEMEAFDTDIAAADAQLAAHAGSQPDPDTGASQLAKKKKKSNKHNNKKKKKVTEVADASDPTPMSGLGVSTIDPNDPFIGQMAEIEAIERGKHVGPEEEAVQKVSVRLGNLAR